MKRAVADVHGATGTGFSSAGPSHRARKAALHPASELGPERQNAAILRERAAAPGGPRRTLSRRGALATVALQWRRMVRRTGTSDTSEAAERRYAELLAARSPRERAMILRGLVVSVRRLAEVSVQRAHPTASPREVAARVAARIYGDEIAMRFFPDVTLT